MISSCLVYELNGVGSQCSCLSTVVNKQKHRLGTDKR